MDQETFINRISILVKNQFPQVFREEGDSLLLFVKSYYEWLEEEYLSQAFSLTEYVDIDSTLDSFVTHFKEKYMKDIPEDILGDKRLLQKHILDIYRAKGSPDAVRLLFILLFNEDIEIYIPSYDILKTSDGNWIQRSYIEITDTAYNEGFDSKIITGTVSGATAAVEWYEERYVDKKKICLLFVNNVRGFFVPNETITYSGLEISNAPRILGSIKSATVISSDPGFEIGDSLEEDTTSRTPAKFRVTALKDLAVGIIEPLIVDGGSGYTMNATVTVTAGTNTTGSGAQFEVGSLSDTSNLDILIDQIEPYLNVALDESDFGFPASGSENISTPLSEAFNVVTYEIGTIATLDTISPGSGYDGNVTITIIDEDIVLSGALAANGSPLGNNSVIYGDASHGSDSALSVRLIDSGFLYHTDNELITLTGANSKTVRISANIEGLGIQEGFYKGTDGFLSNDKKLIDSYYYQEYSYVVRSSKALEKYASILKQTIHPIGNELFGERLFIENASMNSNGSLTISQEES